MSCMANPSGEEKLTLLMATTTSTGGSYCYSDHMMQSSFEATVPEMYNLTANMDTILGFPSKNNIILQDQNTTWKDDHHFFTTRPGNNNNNNPSSSKVDQFYHQQHDLTAISDTIIPSSSSAAWNNNNNNVHDDPGPCVFPCEGNERPSQGLSLSLSSSNSIGLHSFQLRQNIHHQQQFQISNSKYLGPAQDLLNEFCNLGIKEIDDRNNFKSKMKVREWGDVDENGAMIKKQLLYSLDLLELQQRKTRLLHMLEEVDRRYKHYCNQMKSVVQSFEGVAGNGAAKVYSSMASRAMSRHFRCLRDAIVNQIKDTKKAMGDKDSAAPGTIKGETPRLKLLDQTFRQQRALQQMSLMESHPWRPQRGLPERSVSVLRAWLFEHFLHPYPSDVDKHILARQTGLFYDIIFLSCTMNIPIPLISAGFLIIQVSNWFINARVRLWKPMVEEMYLEELKDEDEDHQNNTRNEDQKPTHDQLVIDHHSDQSLSSIININSDTKNNKEAQLHNEHHHPYGTSMDIDFSSYSHHPSVGGGGGGGGGGVSLTLGLHQQGSSLLYSRSDHQMEDCQNTVEYNSLLDSHENDQTNLPYRNLMGAQLLHDLAG
ncbi:hypothetical protein BUALT_Bualt10G0053900 [Buddleja alternifolia]|uniref:Homeobox domain-containing protein n=1 Tax=Buddleja alternifolia TaxID=168488 RepID=A0AAV6WW94_9LAMI|nr:hypothetical protein BUALT_Bualt10G0053900 [Buddleja alternifolia]